MRGYVMFAGLLGLLAGFVLMKLAIGSTIEAWKARCLEAERQRDVFKAAADEREKLICTLMQERYEPETMSAEELLALWDLG